MNNHLLLLNRIKEIRNNFNYFLNKRYLDEINNAYLIMYSALKKKKKIFFCGNGGSAADSQHITAEFLGKYLLKKRRPYSAISLNNNSSVITSISNDDSFVNIFSRQIEGLAQKGDVLFAITTSGKSKNILKAINVAKSLRLETICLTKESVKKKIKCSQVIGVPANRVDRIQELHIVACHLLCELIEESLR